MTHTSEGAGKAVVDREPTGSSRTATAIEALLARLQAAIDIGEIGDCPGCGGSRHYRWGRVDESATQRWRCRGCGRTFTARTGTLGAGLRAPGQLCHILRDMLNERPSSCRKLAATLDLDKSTVWDWRCRISRWLAAQNDEPPALLDQSIEIVRESRKASREWVDHCRDPATYPLPDRLRWLDYRLLRRALPQPMTPYLVPIVIGVVDHAVCHATLSPRNLLPAGHRRAAGGEVSTHVQKLASAFRRFLRPFRGPATRHLVGYVAWFAVRVRAGLEGRGTAEAAAA